MADYDLTGLIDVPVVLGGVAAAKWANRSPYLPISSYRLQEETVFPRSWHKDLLFAVKLIEEKWKRHYPQIEYHAIKKAVTPVPDTETPEGMNTLVGRAGTTQFDPLWGESVPASLGPQAEDEPAGTWEQPHSTLDHDATNPTVHDDVFSIHARMQREAKEKDLKRWGFDEVRDLLVFIPLSLFDLNGIKAQEGDYFVWDGDEYEVLKTSREGWWKNTNIRLYMVMNCEHRKFGS